MNRTRSRRTQPSLAFFLLLNELFKVANHSGIPLITGLTIAFQILLYMRVIQVFKFAFFFIFV